MPMGTTSRAAFPISKAAFVVATADTVSGVGKGYQGGLGKNKPTPQLECRETLALELDLVPGPIEVDLAHPLAVA